RTRLSLPSLEWQPLIVSQRFLAPLGQTQPRLPLSTASVPFVSRLRRSATRLSWAWIPRIFQCLMPRVWDFYFCSSILPRCLQPCSPTKWRMFNAASPPRTFLILLPLVVALGFSNFLFFFPSALIQTYNG